jgi:hypothetical protein
VVELDILANKKTSRPKTIHYALNETEREIIRVVRTLTWLELDDLTDSIVACMPNANSKIMSEIKVQGEKVR